LIVSIGLRLNIEINLLKFKYFYKYSWQFKNKSLPLWLKRKCIFSNGYLPISSFQERNCFNHVCYTVLENNLFNFYFYFMNIYVGNLSYKVRENDLQGVIEEYGAVESCKIIKDRETGKSKGFAFVEMSDDSAAAKVIEELNGAEFDGRSMVVKEARPRN
jgi:RNA recognition motif-containing protein